MRDVPEGPGVAMSPPRTPNRVKNRIGISLRHTMHTSISMPKTCRSSWAVLWPLDVISDSFPRPSQYLLLNPCRIVGRLSPSNVLVLDVRLPKQSGLEPMDDESRGGSGSNRETFGESTILDLPMCSV